MAKKVQTTDLFSGEQIKSGSKETLSQKAKPVLSKGLHMNRKFSEAGIDPLDQIEYEKRDSRITEPNGKVIFEMKNLNIPKSWSQLATDILSSKYIRRAGVPKTGSETSARLVIHRIAHTIRTFGEEQKYFEKSEDAQAFESELAAILITQRGAFNSPVWFNVGLYHEYGIKGNGGNYYWDAQSDKIKESTDSFSHPQGSACFINSVEDDLMSIFELVKTEAKLFKFGSGTGTNFSVLRSKYENLSGGGTSSGLISFLEVLDKGAAATKSGGTTRRAAKMVILDVDHPEIIDFIEWKVKEERKAKILISEGGFPQDFNGEAYKTISGQNSNNSVRVTDKFMQSVEKNGEWQTIYPTNGQVAQTYKAVDIMDKISQAAWETADPGIQFHDTINKWHTCPNTAPINASNPCSEYMFIDNSACNLASVNLTKFLNKEGVFDIEEFRHSCRILFIAQEILVELSSYPTERIARNSHDFRPLGLGYANLGTLLMVKGIPYDSPEARAITGALTAIMTGHAYRVSAEIASVKGPFNGFALNREPMLKVMQMHRSAVDNIDHESCPIELLRAAREDWDTAIEMGKQFGFRNAQATVLAPTGTIGLLMDCDTTGIEPDFSLIKYKKLAGGGSFRIVNESIHDVLKNLNYSGDEILDIINYVKGLGDIENAPHINPAALMKMGLTEKDIKDAREDLKKSKVIYDQTRHINADTLLLKGLTKEQIEAALFYVNGHETVEGAPHLKTEHYAIFDTATTSGSGKRFIAPLGHVRMMAAAQPFLSGAISKTVNMPHETTVEDIKQIYFQSWKLGLKAIAIYRDGCKISQVLSSGSSKGQGKKKEENKENDLLQEALKQIIPRGEKMRLPQKRHGVNYQANISGQTIYFRTGEYENGELGEIFIDMFRAGASYKSLLHCFAVAVSLGLQYGVPLEKFVDKFTFTRFDPSGFTDDERIRSTTSVLDYIFRSIAIDYLGRTDLMSPQNDISTDDTTHNIKEDLISKKIKAVTTVKKESRTMSDHLHQIDPSAPQCNICHSFTVRNGACYRCVNCGNSMGCS